MHIPTGMLNGGIQKKILNNKGSIRFNMRDILKTFSPSGRIDDIVGATATYHNTVDTQVATLSFTYSFGKLTHNQRKRDTGSADSEQSRVNH